MEAAMVRFLHTADFQLGMKTRYLDADRNLLEEKDFETEQDAQEYRLSVLGAEHIEPTDE